MLQKRIWDVVGSERSKTSLLVGEHCLQSFAFSVNDMTKTGTAAVVMLRLSCSFNDKKMEEFLIFSHHLAA
jgi:hypothetical protein